MKKMIIAFIALCTLSVTAFAEVNIKACTGCHGVNFEKSAMGKSKIVANMSQKSVTDALVGYKNGTYGGPMKNIMKMQVSKYSDEELQNTGLGKKSFTDKVKEVSTKALEKTKSIAATATTKTKEYFSGNTVALDYEKSCIDDNGHHVIVVDNPKHYKDYSVLINSSKLKHCK